MEEYSTTGGQGAWVSKLLVPQPVSQSIAIRRAAGGSVEHLAVYGIVFLSGIKAFGGAPSAFTGATQVEQKTAGSLRRRRTGPAPFAPGHV